MSGDQKLMANLEGYVHLHKSIRRNPIWLREPFTYGQAFADLVMLAVDAASAPQTVWVQGESVILERGQVGWSIARLAEEWKRTRPWVTAFLKYCAEKGMLTVDSNHRRTIITLCNYDTYQTTDDATGFTTDQTTDQTTDDATGFTHKGKGEMVNGKREKEKDNLPPRAEVPDERTLAEWFAGFTDLARGVQGIPEGWWRGWVSSRLNAGRWPEDWQASARQAFLGDWARRHPKAVGGGYENNAAGAAAKSAGRTPAQARFEVSRELEQVRERLDSAHEINVEPSAADVKREKELEGELKKMG